ncbi:MAG: MGMT family protein [Frankiales bacterium]|nr:MGMT family protein [Frankiales bacterium]
MEREPTLFATRVLDAVDRIPRGRVMSYGDVAEYVGAGSARAVGRVMAIWGSEVPWHRVLHNDGTCADHKSSYQLDLLRTEGVPFAGARVDMAKARWDGRPATPRRRPT